MGALILKQLAVTEKATGLQAEGKYVFVVAPGANKTEVKKAVEKKYKVKVVAVNMINEKPKPRRFRGVMGKKSRAKKAIVALAEGNVIKVA